MDAQGGPRECKGWGTNCLANEENLEKRESTDMLSPVIRETILPPVFNAASVSVYHQAEGILVK